MRFLIIALALIATAAADVSHLNNMYLPPVQSNSGLRIGASVDGPAQHQEIAYPQQAEEVPIAIGADTYTPAHFIDQESQQESQQQPQQESQQESQQDSQQESQQDSQQDVSAPIGGNPGAFGGDDSVSSSEEDVPAPIGGNPIAWSGDDLSGQKAGFADYSIDNSIAVPESPAAQGPIIRASLPQDSVVQLVAGPQETHSQYNDAAPSGIDTQYGANGGYVY